jgi:hypothetical protein
MRHKQRSFFLKVIASRSVLLGCLLGLLAASAITDERAAGFCSVVSARQQQGPSAPQKAPQDPDPVAITPRAKPQENNSTQEIGEGQFGTFVYPVINNKGAVAFVGRFPLPTPQKAGQSIFIRAADGTWQIVREGDKATNLDEPLLSFNNPTLNDQSDLTFISSFGQSAVLQNVGGGEVAAPAPGETRAHTGIFTRTAAGIKKLVQVGEEVPRMPSRFGGFSNPSANSKGMVAFIGTYVDPDGRGLFFLENDKLSLIARSGQKIGPGEDAVFSEHYYPSRLNERGEIAWFSRISGGGGIFVKREKGIEAVAIQNKPSPIAGANYIGFGQIAPAINDKGEVVFVGFYDGPNAGRALLMKGEGPVKVVAKSGDTITGTTASFTSFSNPSINNRGDIAFIGSYGGRTRGIFLKTAKGIETIALAEDRVPGGGKDDLFNNFNFPSVNDRGEVIFLGQLKNATVGIFIKDASGLKKLVMRGDKMPLQ